jgi:hypothetical protein
MLAERFVWIMTFLIYATFYDVRLLYIFLSLWTAIGIFHLVTPWKYNNLRRKIAIGQFDEPREGIIYNRYELDVTNINRYIKEVKEKLNLKVTMTHVIVKAVGELLKDAPDINGKIVFGKVRKT